MKKMSIDLYKNKFEKFEMKQNFTNNNSSHIKTSSYL